MEKLTAGSPETRSADLTAENATQLRVLFPEAFSEGKVDFEVLRQILGDQVEDREEKYGLNWHGKRKARQLALTPSNGTLRPCPNESRDWGATNNLMIEGDNLEVLKLLQKSYAGGIKLIYIDPPYNTGNDFVYPDDFQDNIKNYMEITGQVSGGNKVSSNTESSGRFHTDWLNMIYPRLKVARNLLQEDGVICISIDDTEEANLRKVCDDIFGEENHLATIVWQKRYVSNVTAKWLSDMHDFIIIYAKSINNVKIKSWDRTEEQLEAYKNPDDDPRGVWRAQDLSASKPYAAGMFTIKGPTGNDFNPPPNRYWRCNSNQFEEWLKDDRIWWGVKKDARPMLKAFLDESENGITPHTWWDYNFAGHNKEATLELKDLFGGNAPFDTPKPTKLIRRLIELFCLKNDTVMDFFAGSGVLAHAAMAYASEESTDLRWISVQLPEPTGRDDYPTISDITKERIRRAAQSIRKASPLFAGDLGFRVFKLAPSNIRAWEPHPDDLSGTLLDSVEHVVAGRTEDDILFELLLKLGLDLTVPIELKEIRGKKVHSIGGGILMVCLDSAIGVKDYEPLALGIAAWHKELAPAGETTLVFRDGAFADDVTKTNLTAILSQNGLDNVRSL